MKRAVFFDIDGTLWDDKFYIPESTKKGIEKLRKNNVLTFLCSGRTKAFITDPKLLSLGFDGMIAGCGTYIEYRGEILSEKIIEKDDMKKMISFFKSHEIPAILEGSINLYLDEDDFEDASYPNRMKKLVGDRLLPILGNDKFHVNKFSCGLTKKSHRDLLLSLQNDYEVLLHDLPIAEILPKGYGKFFGIQEICKHLDVKRENTYAFGDSVNDLDMLKYAGQGIAMGNGCKTAKDIADYVTSSLHEDGIYRALEHYELIK